MDMQIYRGVKFIFSPEFTCCGYHWRLSIVIGYIDGTIDLRLHNMTNEDVTIEWALSMRNSYGTEVVSYSPTDHDERHFDAHELGATCRRCRLLALRAICRPIVP